MPSDYPGIRLPDDWELIGFFEGEPELEDDPGYGWQYNTLRFRTTRGEDQVECVLTPSYGELNIKWWKADEKIIELALCFAERLTVHSEHGREWMHVEFEESRYLLPLVLQLKPRIEIEWGTTRWL